MARTKGSNTLPAAPTEAELIRYACRAFYMSLCRAHGSGVVYAHLRDDYSLSTQGTAAELVGAYTRQSTLAEIEDDVREHLRQLRIRGAAA